MKKIIVILAIFILWPTFSIAQSDDLSVFRGEWLYKYYLGYKSGNNLDSLVYVSYVAGVVDSDIRAQKYNQMNAIWCQPDGAVMEQYYDIVGHYLEIHPELRQNHKIDLINAALKEAWPCVSR